MSSLSQLIPGPLKSVIRPPVNAFRLMVDYFERKSHQPRVIPPRSLRRAGKGIQGYIDGGQWQVKLCQMLGGLTPHTHVLDVGCGDGRFASALEGFITEGSYSTFEVNQQYVKFLASHISARNPKFHFIHADLWHSYYNPQGTHKTTNYRFPFDDNRFDLIYLNSIFTHFLPDEITHYLSEIHRVLRPGGRVVASYFLVNEESLKMDEAGTTEITVRRQFPRALNHRFEHYYTRDLDTKECIVGIDQPWLEAVYRTQGLTVKHIEFGTWCGRPATACDTQQDFIVAIK